MLFHVENRIFQAFIVRANGSTKLLNIGVKELLEEKEIRSLIFIFDICSK